MTFQEANKNSRNLFSRNNLNLIEIEQRLLKYFSEEEISKFLSDCRMFKSWTDGNIVILYFRDEDSYSIVSSGIYMELIEP